MLTYKIQLTLIFNFQDKIAVRQMNKSKFSQIVILIISRTAIWLYSTSMMGILDKKTNKFIKIKINKLTSKISYFKMANLSKSLEVKKNRKTRLGIIKTTNNLRTIKALLSVKTIYKFHQ